MYTIHCSKIEDVLADDNGAYLNSRSTSKKYHVIIDRVKNSISATIVHKDNGENYYCNERSGGHSYKKVPVPNDEIWILKRYYRISKSIPGLKRLIVKVKALDNDLYEPHLCIVYSCKKTILQEIQPHGNCKNLADSGEKSSRPYIRTSSETLRKGRELISANPGE